VKITSIAVALFVAVTALPAHAGDGVIEINQSCIRETGNCFQGGGVGFPVVLQAGSYRLTGNITVPDANTDAIRLYDGATLDLAGFSITGPTSCTGTPAACTGTGSGDGILVLGENATIRNGRVAGFGRFGIFGNGGLRVENVALEMNGVAGLDSQGAGVQVVGCRAIRNGQDGFSAAYQGGAVMFLGNSAWANGDDGFDVSNALLLDNTARQNGDIGINAAYADPDTALARNVASDNGGGTTGEQIAGGYRFGPNLCQLAVCP
jgi:hypothetical protein